MSSQAILEQKKLIVNEITDKMKNSTSFVIVDYKGITVEQVTKLREKARAAGVEYKIYKNTYLRFAAKETGYEDIIPCLTESTAIAFCEEDSIAPAKVIADFVKENNLKILNFKGGVIERQVTSAEHIAEIAKLPGKEALIAKMLGCLNATIANFAYVINAIKEQKEAPTEA